MPSRVVVIGNIVRTESRTTRTGAAYLLAFIDDGDGRQWAAFVFRPSMIEGIERLPRGAEVEVEGRFDAKLFDGDITYRLKVERIIRPQRRAVNEAQTMLAFDESPSRLIAIANGFRRFHAYMRNGAANANDN